MGKGVIYPEVNDLWYYLACKRKSLEVMSAFGCVSVPEGFCFLKLFASLLSFGRTRFFFALGRSGEIIGLLVAPSLERVLGWDRFRHLSLDSARCGVGGRCLFLARFCFAKIVLTKRSTKRFPNAPSAIVVSVIDHFVNEDRSWRARHCQGKIGKQKT